jgi:two-component system phosphate regulon response regulator PhoB
MAQKRVMLVDDDRDCRAVLRAILERLKIRVVEAADGRQALQHARRRHPDLIVMDIRMPGMNGVDACRAFKSDAQLRHIPIVVLSGAMRQNRLDQIARLDELTLYDAYVAKPFQYAAVLNIVKERLGLTDRGAEPGPSPIVGC